MKNLLPVVFALGTAFFWGLYAPVLAKSRNPAVYSVFKPYVGIGLAYLVFGVLAGLVAMWLIGDEFTFTGKHSPALTWGFAAGTLGTLGALSLTVAMFSGGTAVPHIVMPIVFGGAVSVIAITSVIQHSGHAKISPWLWVGIAGMIVCIVVVAANTPHAKPPGSTPPRSAGEEAP